MQLAYETVIKGNGTMSASLRRSSRYGAGIHCYRIDRIVSPRSKRRPPKPHNCSDGELRLGDKATAIDRNLTICG